MTIDIGNFNTMMDDATAHSDAASRSRLQSLVTVAQWLFESEETGDLNLGRWVVEGSVYLLHLNVKGDPPDRVYRVVVDDQREGVSFLWDVVDQQLRGFGGGLAGGKPRPELKRDSAIAGTIVDALNEVEKARAVVDAIVNP